LDWASDHRKHHKHVDHDDDPYDISKGFFWAHIGWLLFKLGPEKPMDNVNDLKRDPLVMWQHRWCFVLAFTVGFALPVILGYLWGGISAALGAFLIAGILRVFAVQHSTFFINSMCHTFGHQPYSNRCSARDSLLMALFTFGEGYHNYHHEFQHDYRNGVKKTNFDPTKWTIWLLEKIGLVSDLRRVKESKILFAEMTEATRRAQLLLESKQLSRDPIPDDPRHSTWHILVGLWQERTKINLENLKTSIDTGSEISKEHLDKWRRETRIFISQVSKLKSFTAIRAS
jgi:stearoyl-CoA desaturase (delta-9 desaturase)